MGRAALGPTPQKLAGIRFVLRAALLTGEGFTRAERKALEHSEREARKRLRRAVTETGDAGSGRAP